MDDEPDVLSVSKLAMKNFEVYGLPLKIYTAESKAEALELLNSRPEMFWGLAVAFVDVVMESDTAGLELCQHMRAMGNKITQLFIRTGQPGIAPERTVIDRYDINGYFTKAEATEEKLYSLVKSGVRQFLWSTLSFGALNFLDAFLAAPPSREVLAQMFAQIVERLSTSGGAEYTHGWIVGDTAVSLNGFDEQTARDLIAKLDQEAGTPLSEAGDKFVTDDNNHLLIKAAASSSRVEGYGIMETNFTPPVEIVGIVHRVLSGLGTAWHKAA